MNTTGVVVAHTEVRRIPLPERGAANNAHGSIDPLAATPLGISLPASARAEQAAWTAFRRRRSPPAKSTRWLGVGWNVLTNRTACTFATSAHRCDDRPDLCPVSMAQLTPARYQRHSRVHSRLLTPRLNQEITAPRDAPHRQLVGAEDGPSRRGFAHVWVSMWWQVGQSAVNPAILQSVGPSRKRCFCSDSGIVSAFGWLITQHRCGSMAL